MNVVGYFMLAHIGSSFLLSDMTVMSKDGGSLLRANAGS